MLHNQKLVIKAMNALYALAPFSEGEAHRLVDKLAELSFMLLSPLEAEEVKSYISEAYISVTTSFALASELL